MYINGAKYAEISLSVGVSKAKVLLAEFREKNIPSLDAFLRLQVP